MPLSKQPRTLRSEVLSILKRNPGLSDGEITLMLRGKVPHQPVNAICRKLCLTGEIHRERRTDGRLGSYIVKRSAARIRLWGSIEPQQEGSTEDFVKAAIQKKLQREGWSVRVAYGRARGCDIEAERSKEKWRIEAKGRGKHSTMRHNYFLAVIGQMVMCFDSTEQSRNSIALPRLPQYERLWSRVPLGLKQKTSITVLFVDVEGNVVEER